MSWASFVDILNDPSESIDSFNFPEVRADRQTRRHATDRLMEESRVAGAEAPHKVVHRQFEGFGIFDGDDALALVFRAFGPTRAVEPRIEIIPEYGFFRLIEDFGALFPAEPLGSVEGFFSSHLQSP